jgi:sigma-B regulation protein RsbU (phosphoserine phosphatase)
MMEDRSTRPAAQIAGELQALQHELDTMWAILHSLTEGVIVADQDGRFLLFNPVAERILGIGLRDINPAEWTSVYGCYRTDKVTPFPPEELPLTRATRGEEVIDEVIFIRNSEQREGVWISVSSSPLRDATGVVIGGVVIFRDITQRQDALEKYARFARAVEQTADSIVITDKEGIIEYVNPGFEATTGYSREEALGKTPRILKSGHHNREFYEKLWQQVSSGNHFRGTILNRKKNGELYWAEQTITPIKDDNGHITNFVSVLKDITELKKKQEQDLQLSIARKVQQQLYPTAVSLPGFDIAGGAYPADETGGDYFDYIPTSDGSLWIVVGDVSSHGIGSALVMAETRAYLRAFVTMESKPGDVLAKVNWELAADTDQERFVTLTLARLDPQNLSLVYASAGHIPSYVINSSGKVSTAMNRTGLPLGIFRDSRFSSSETIKLSPGDVIVFLTDGVTEATAPDKTEFGSDRVIRVINRYRHTDARQMVEHLFNAVRSFSDYLPQQDDIASVICKVNTIS